MKIETQKYQHILLLIIRLWLGYSMIMGGQSFFGILNSASQRSFFENWFGTELGLPLPVFMAFCAKGIEFFGGILVCLGLFSRIAASLIAFVMVLATFLANLNYHNTTENFIRQDGLVTVSCMLFGLVIFTYGAGKYSVDNLIIKK
jgi:putative oxidoreductase